MMGFTENHSDGTAKVVLSVYRPVPIGLPPPPPPVLKLEMLLKETVLEFSSLSITFSYRNVRRQLTPAAALWKLLTISMSRLSRRSHRKRETPHVPKIQSTQCLSHSEILRLSTEGVVFGLLFILLWLLVVEGQFTWSTVIPKAIFSGCPAQGSHDISIKR